MHTKVMQFTYILKSWNYTDSESPAPKELISSTLYIKGVMQPLDYFNNVSASDTFALPELFDDKVGAKGPDAILDYCKEKAEVFGFKIFGADNKSCWSGDDAKNT